MITTTTLSAKPPRSYDDVIVWGVIAFVGALGVAIGLLAPGRTIEPAVGSVMLLFVAATAVSERRRRRMARTSDD